jgi:hypothetical protein
MNPLVEKPGERRLRAESSLSPYHRLKRAANKNVPAEARHTQARTRGIHQ